MADNSGRSAKYYNAELLRTVHLVPLTAYRSDGSLDLDAQAAHTSRMYRAGMRVFLCRRREPASSTICRRTRLFRSCVSLARPRGRTRKSSPPWGCSCRTPSMSRGGPLRPAGRG